ncbi:MAG: helix-turn-helix transcriptional regulator [Vallitalea sp.]|jgi:transcriptional regulator with XRE-family HTH domain|nr:helix-turn-helix transcriptional regulator [Vallitalea sp.]
MKKDNIYREAREKYNENSETPLNREEAADRLHISGATLGRYETGENAPNPEVVFSMSKVYENPVLRRKHCSTCCLIGKEDHPYSAPKTLFESGYGLINANRVLEKFKTELFEVLADGIVDKNEIIKLREIIPQIKSVQKLLSDIEIEIEKHSLRYDIDK